MHIEECYQEMGGSYADVIARLPSPQLIHRFVLKFLEDPSYAALCGAMDVGSRETAFRAAHTLKGVCANLGFARLLESASALTEILRLEADDIPESAFHMMEKVRGDYQLTVNAIRRYRDEA
ncbi:MAG: Hpt domain-containing protein [Clostridia bacterium]|nr:Hpt domain-containing protein [Clostridia bacterium]